MSSSYCYTSLNVKSLFTILSILHLINALSRDLLPYPTILFHPHKRGHRDTGNRNSTPAYAIFF